MSMKVIVVSIFSATSESTTRPAALSKEKSPLASWELISSLTSPSGWGSTPSLVARPIFSMFAALGSGPR